MVSALVLVAANLVALYGIVALGWDVFPLLLVYWIENLVIGVLNAARMLCAGPPDRVTWREKLRTVPFFCLHYGLFAAIHGTLVVGFFGERYESEGVWPLPGAVHAVADYGLELTVAALAASHLFSFLWNYLWLGEYRRASLDDLMGQPYHRVAVLHGIILGGGFAADFLGSPLWALAPLIAIKIALDVHAHLKEHKKLGRSVGD